MSKQVRLSPVLKNCSDEYQIVDRQSETYTAGNGIDTLVEVCQCNFHSNESARSVRLHACLNQLQNGQDLIASHH